MTTDHPAPSRPPLLKSLRRKLRGLRYALARRFFDSRFGRDLLINAIGPRIRSMTADCGDHVMSFDPGDYIGRKIFRKGHFERPQVERLVTLLRARGLIGPDMTLLELGGNIGTQTVYFGLSNAYARIVSVEADPRNVRLLRQNIEQNGLSRQVSVVHCAAGDRRGEMDFFQHRNNHGKSSAIRQSVHDTLISVKVMPVGDILEEAGVVAETVGLIWMDIEGYEPVACRSMESLMFRRVPLYLEFSPAIYGPQQAADFVRYLSGFYAECIVYREDREPMPMAVRDIPTVRDQFDILLLP